MLPFEFPEEEVRWNPDSACIEFAVIVRQYKGTVRVPAVLFKRFLGHPASPEKCFEAFHLHRMQFEQAAEAKLLRREISEDGNIDLLGQDLTHAKWRSPTMRRVLTALLLSVLATSQAWAWGSEGHRIIGEIAEQYLEPATARQVRDLLALENATTLAEVSTWADEIRQQRRNTAPWHFVDIPVSASAYDPARDCPHQACVVAKIDQFIAEFRDRTLPPRQRLEALKFVVHFIGDVHQPLHAADNGDRGGNQIKAEFLGHRTNLHAVWDTGILAPAVRGDERDYALRLLRLISPGEIAKWRGGSAADWANESHAVAQRIIYGELPHAPGLLPASYERAALPIVNEQLEKAGVRLAAVLNAVMGR